MMTPEPRFYLNYRGKLKPAHIGMNMDKKPRLALCILHYGEPALTERLHIQLLHSESARAVDIMVLDNAAPKPYPIAWRRTTQNLYWGGAFALFLEEAARLGYSHVWFCNNDISFVSSGPYLAKMESCLVRQSKRGRVGAISPAFTSNPYHKQMKQMEGQGCTSVPYLDGIAPMVCIEAVQEVGGLDCADNPYGYGVDIWITLRLAQAGWQVLVEHDMLMHHRFHATAMSINGFMEKAARAEDTFMRIRLGSGWREQLQQMIS